MVHMGHNKAIQCNLCETLLICGISSIMKRDETFVVANLIYTHPYFNEYIPPFQLKEIKIISIIFNQFYDDD
jgi:hypothetical protein